MHNINDNLGNFGYSGIWEQGQIVSILAFTESTKDGVVFISNFRKGVPHEIK